jgi:PAS domain S-box-containing protein
MTITKQTLHSEPGSLSAEELYRIIAEYSADWELLLDNTGRILFCSPSCEKISGHPPEAFYNDPALLQRIIHPTDQPKAEQFKVRLQNKTPVSSTQEPDDELNFRITLPSGQQRWINFICRPAFDSAGNAVGWRCSGRDITNIQDIAEIAHQSYQMMQALFNTPNNLAVVLDLDGTILMANETISSRSGRTPEEMIGLNMFKLLPPHLANSRQITIDKVVQTKQTLRFVDHGVRAVLESYVHPIFDDHGEVIQIAVLAQDITEQHQALLALRNNEATIRALINAPSDMIILLDQDGVILTTNDAYAKTTSFSVPELIGKKLWAFYPPHVVEFRKRIFDEVFKTGKPQRIEDSSPSGQIFDSIVYPIFDDQGNVDRVVVLARNITEYKRTFAALQASEARYRALVDTSPDAIFLTNLRGHLQMANQQFLDMFGYTSLGEMQVADMTIDNLVIKRDRRRIIKVGRKTVLKGSIRNLEFTGMRSNGKTFPIETSASAILDDRGQPTGIMAALRDVSERKAIEETMHADRTTIRALINGPLDVTGVFDLQGKVLIMNESYAQLYGKTPEETVGVNLWDMIPPEEAREAQATLKKVLNTRQTFRYTRDEGQAAYDIVIYPLFDRNNEIDRFAVLGRDITELKHAERALEKHRLELEKLVAERTAELADANQELLAQVQERARAEQLAQQSARRAEALARVAARLNAQIDLKSTLETVCIETAQVVNYESCSVILYDEEKNDLYLAATSLITTNPEMEEQMISISRTTYHDFVQAQGEIVEIPEVYFPGEMPTLKKTTPLLNQVSHPAYTVVSIPLHHNRRFIGSLNAVTKGNSHLPSKAECDLLTALAGQASVAIANARLYQQAQEGRERLKTFSQQLVQTLEDERKKLSLELHDQIGQMITYFRMVLNMGLKTARQSQALTPRMAAEINRSLNLAEDLMQRVRNLSSGLRPALLDDFGLTPALRAHFDQYHGQTGIKVDFKHNLPEGIRFSNEVETTAFRLIQEALTNAARYAGVQQVTVRLWSDKQTLELIIEDQGCGFDAERVLKTKHSGGLPGMIERTTWIGGVVEIESQPGAGVCITADLPLNFSEIISSERIS